MPAQTDHDLLDRFIHAQDSEAFNELARRYLNLIHSAATRRVADRALAHDITQAVLMILAKRPQAARKSASLSAWLLTTVRYAAANALKIEERRRRHEKRAALTAQPGICSPDPSDALLWQELAAQLDDAVLKLPAQDRRAVLLRYFEERPIREVAQAMSITEDAARQRLSRSVSKLRDHLTRRGVSLTAQTGAATLATLLTAHAVEAAPSTLFTSTTAGTLIASGSSTSLTIAKGAITMMTWTKIKAIAAMLALVSVLGAGTALTINHAGAQQAPAKAASELQDRANARVKAAEKVVEILTAQMRSGITSVNELAPAQRRLAEARIDAAADAPAKQRAAEDYVKQCRQNVEIVKAQNQAGVVTAAAVPEADYFLADAEYVLAKLH